MKKVISILFVLIFAILRLDAQVFTNKEISRGGQPIVDSLKNIEYPYSLPIWGEKAAKAGYTLPYSAGLSVQYFWQESDIIIDQLMVGFNNGPMFSLDEFLRFENALVTANSITVRPDIWLFPFLNLYGVLGKTNATTQIEFGAWLPDGSSGSTEIFSAQTMLDFNATTFGIGLTPTIGVGGGFLALDMNLAWTDVPQLDRPARTFVFGPRFGKNFNLRKPESTIAVWFGGFRVDLFSQTRGSLPLSEIFPKDNLGMKIDTWFENMENSHNQLEDWWNGLDISEQNKPTNNIRYEKTNEILDRAGLISVAADRALSNIEASTVQYEMQKRPADKWNFLIGSQYQINKNFMLRTEVGFLASRTQVITGFQYRFGL
jgi:hypothetical protein